MFYAHENLSLMGANDFNQFFGSHDDVSFGVGFVAAME